VWCQRFGPCVWGDLERMIDVRKVMRAAAGVMVGLAAFGGCAPAYAGESDSPAGGWVLSGSGARVDVSGVPGCVSEDQPVGPCFWDATGSGVGGGRSFLVGGDGSVSYVERVAIDGASAPTTSPSSVSTEGVHSTASSAVVDGPVDIPTSSSRSKVVGSVDSGVKSDYDHEVALVCAVVVVLGLGLSVWWSRRR
jgi:hypothetical protein